MGQRTGELYATLAHLSLVTVGQAGHEVADVRDRRRTFEPLTPPAFLHRIPLPAAWLP
jgi:hypothetical protein